MFDGTKPGPAQGTKPFRVLIDVAARFFVFAFLHLACGETINYFGLLGGQTVAQLEDCSSNKGNAQDFAVTGKDRVRVQTEGLGGTPPKKQRCRRKDT